ncbi:site-specific integrase [Thalassomonas sp. RHCl1]|uniref:site-specific integrase n=1 Tax=Thalassomonas sp. RHCl1 TaxID=2995320 RepID=UPI00248C9A30|nr:site-specific integrase [Thalassomonas sp. RHCl1]
MATYQTRNGRVRATIRSKHLAQNSLSKTFDSQKEAKAWVKKEEAKITLGQQIKAQPLSNIYFNQLVDHHQVKILKISESKAEDIADKKNRKKFNELARLKKNFQGYTLSEMTPQVIAGYIAKRMLTDEVCWDTVKRDMQDITAVLETAVFDLEYNVDYEIVKKGVKVFDKKHKTVKRKSVKRTRRLSDEEFEILVKCKRKYATVVLFAAETSMRRGELARLIGADVDLDKKLLKINRSKIDEHLLDKGLEAGRVIPLSNRAIELYKRLEKKNPEALVLGCTDPGSITQGWDRLAKDLGFTDLRFHDMRHEATSRLFEKDLAIPKVSAITGHMDWESLKRYTQLNPEKLVDLLND